MSFAGDLKKLRSLYRHGDWQQVIGLGEALRKEAPDEHFAGACLAVAYNATNQEEKALRLCEKLYRSGEFDDVQSESQEIGVSALRYQTVLAGLYYKQQRFDEALRICERLKVLGNKLADKFVVAGRIYLAQGRYKQAAEEFAQLLEARSDRADVAISCMKELLAADPSNETAHRALHDDYERKGTLRKQIAETEAYLAKNQRDLGTALALGFLYRFSGSPHNAITLWTHYVTISPNDAHLLLALGAAYFDQEDFARAEETWTQFEPTTASEVEALVRHYTRLFSRKWSSEPALRRLVELGVRWDRLDDVEGPLKIMREIKPDSALIVQILEKVLLLQIDKYTKSSQSNAVFSRLKDLTRLKPDELGHRKKLNDFLAAHPELQPRKAESRLAGEAPAEAATAQAGDGFALLSHGPEADATLQTMAEAMVVFDLCDSTNMASKFGDRYLLEMKKMLSESAEPIFKKYEARWISSTGDGYVVALPNSRVAASACVEIMRIFGSQDQASGKLRIELRASIHFGETHVDANGSRHGQVVHKTFRIEGVKPDDLMEVEGSVPRSEVPLRNRIFISEEVESDLQDNAAAPCRFIGITELKGFSGFHRIYELMWR